MKVVEFHRVLPRGSVRVAVNPEQVVWVQEGDDRSTMLFMEAGPEVEVVGNYGNTVRKLIFND